MRLASIAALGFALAGGAWAQSLAEHAAAAAGATIGTAAGKPLANTLGGIFGQVDDATATAAKTGDRSKVKATIPPDQRSSDKSATTNRAGGPGAFSPGFGAGSGAEASTEPSSGQSGPSRRRGGPMMPGAQIVPAMIAEPVKEPSLEEVAGVQIGTTEKDLFAALGKPESHVIVPDDDGHLRESCQYWANGRQLGTIRLDNGQVVKVEVRAQ